MLTYKATLTIDGMMCGMCEAHICDVIRKTVPDARKVAASHRKGEATFLTEIAVDEGKLRAEIAATGYDCTRITVEPYERKGLFSGR